MAELAIYYLGDGPHLLLLLGLREPVLHECTTEAFQILRINKADRGGGEPQEREE